MTIRLAYDVAEAAEAVSVSTDTIRAAIRAGDLAARYVGRKQIIPAAELEAWLNALPSERAPREAS